IALRMPSVIAACVATLLLYRLGKRLLDREAALLAGIVFVASAGVAFHAADARPYALALAFLVASTLALVRWLDRRRTRDLIAYAVLAALTVYTHYLFAVAILAHVPYAVYRLRSRGRRWWLHLLTPFLLVAVLLLPAIPHLVFLSGRTGLYSVPRSSTIGDWFSIVFPPVLVGSA